MNADSVVYCHCAYAGVTPEPLRRKALERLCQGRAQFFAMADLCECAGRRDPLLKVIAGSGRILIAACHPRAVRWLFAAAGAALPLEKTAFLDLRSEDAAEKIDSLPPGEAAGAENAQAAWNRLERSARGAWTPWFPVIDYDRCVGCRQCVNFCLFGVYAPEGADKIAVGNPERCKTGCPACARICPETAIIFPRYKAAPINGGEGGAEESPEETVRVDLSHLTGAQADLYAALRARASAGPGAEENSTRRRGDSGEKLKEETNSTRSTPQS